jgi:hypothetical protein
MGLRRTSARCQVLFLLFWLDWSQRLHWEVDILLVLGYIRSGLTPVMVSSGSSRHIALLWILRGEMQEYRHRWFSADYTGPVCGELGGNIARAQDSYGTIVETLRMIFDTEDIEAGHELAHSLSSSTSTHNAVELESLCNFQPLLLYGWS